VSIYAFSFVAAVSQFSFVHAVAAQKHIFAALPQNKDRTKTEKDAF
jgi:hypothetical protein